MMSATSAQIKDFSQNDYNKRRQDLLCKFRVSIVTHSLPRGLPRVDRANNDLRLF